MSCPPPVNIRGLLRAAAACKIAASGLVAPGQVYLEYDWPVPDAKLPAINVSTPRWHNADRSEGLGGPQYWSQLTLQVEYRHQANNRAEVVASVDAASAFIELLLQSFIVYRPKQGAVFRRIVQSDGEMSINSDGEKHEGGAALTLVFEYATDYLPVLSDYLQEIVCTWIAEFASGDSDVNTPLRRVLAGAEFIVQQVPWERRADDGG